MAFTEASTFRGNFSSGMLSQGSPASAIAESAAVLAMLEYLSRRVLCIVAHTTVSLDKTRAPSQYKDRLIYVWRFPC